MLRIFTDFQATEEGACYILRCGNLAIEDCADRLSLAKGDKVILDASEDFEVIGTLDFKFVKMLARDAWVAYPDWTTRAEKAS
jgi:hypothetical protein